MMHDKQHEATARKMAGNGANFAMILQRLNREGVDDVSAELFAETAIKIVRRRQRLQGAAIVFAGIVLAAGSAVWVMQIGTIRPAISGLVTAVIVAGVGVMTISHSYRPIRVNSRERF
jgi:hypothetical protein